MLHREGTSRIKYVRHCADNQVVRKRNKMKQTTDNYTFLTHAPVHKVIVSMAVPTIISMLITSIYGMVDTYYVGKINTQSTAAVGISFSVMTIIQAIGFFFGHGSGNYISRCLGSKETEKARCMAVTGLLYSFAFGLLVSVVGLVFLTDISCFLGSTETIQPYTERYLGIILCGAPFMTSSFTLNNQMRFQGNAKYAMYGILSGVLLNVVLAPILIFYFCLGITGAAVATLVSQIMSFFILFKMTRHSGNIAIRLKDYVPSWLLVKEIVAGGTPSLSRQGLASVATIMLNVSAGAYGDAAIAGMSIVTRISNFVYAGIVGLGQGFQPLCGFCYGARLYDRIYDGYMYCVKIGTVFFVILTVIGFLFTSPIIGEFRDDPHVIAVGCAAFRWQLATYPLIAVIILTNMLSQTARKPIRANVVAAARSGLFFIPAVIILPKFLGLAGVEMSQAVSDLCSFLLSVPVAWSVFRDMKREMA